MYISGKTDIGLHRANNQDSFAVGELPSGGAWAVVCDGMGGHAGGHIASKLAVDCISERIRTGFYESISVSSIKNMLESAIVFANSEIFEKAEKYRELRGMGTTVVAAVYYADVAVIASVGDSRCYSIDGREIKQITKDHSFVQQLVDSGDITPEMAIKHPMKNIITRALGIEDDVQVDFFDLSYNPDTSDGNDKKFLLLCTDGLSNCVSDEEMIACLYDKNTSESVTDEQVEKLVALANQNGGSDNITAVIVAVN